MLNFKSFILLSLSTMIIVKFEKRLYNRSWTICCLVEAYSPSFKKKYAPSCSRKDTIAG